MCAAVGAGLSAFATHSIVGAAVVAVLAGFVLGKVRSASRARSHYRNVLLQALQVRSNAHIHGFPLPVDIFFMAIV